MKNKEKLKKLIREAYIKKKVKNSLKEAIQKLFEKDKEFMEEVKSMIMDEVGIAPAPTTTPQKPVPTTEPETKPTPKPDPRKVPNPGIKTEPKAVNENINYKGKNISILQPSGYFEYYSDEKGRFVKSDDLDSLKGMIDAEVSKKKV